MHQMWNKYRKLAIIAITFIIVASVAQIGYEIIKGMLLDVALKREFKVLIKLGTCLLVLIVVKAGGHYIYIKTFKILMVRALADMRRDMVQGIVNKDYLEYYKHKTGEYMGLYTQQIDAVQWSYFISISGLLQIITEVTFAMIGLMWIDGRFGIIAGVFIVLIIYLPESIKNSVNKLQETKIKISNDHIGYFSEWIKGISVISEYNAKNEFLRCFKCDVEKIKSISSKYGAIASLVNVLGMFLTQIGLITVIIAGVLFVASEQLSVGMFLAAVGMMEKIQNQVVHVANYKQQLMVARVAINNIRKVNENRSKKQYIQSDEEVTVEEIVFKNVSYVYPDRPEREIIKDFNLRIDKPGIYLISGRSGCGKSTLMRLLQNYYFPNAGEISINQTSVDKLHGLSDYISVMGQEITFFEDTMRNNLTMYQSISEEVIIGCMRNLGLQQYAASEALDEHMTADGLGYSGGEIRRLGFVRSILKQSPILILDEPLANLDEESMNQILTYIMNQKDKYIFIISHKITECLVEIAEEQIDMSVV